MAKIGLVIKPGIEAARSLGHELLRWAKRQRYDVVLERGTADLLAEGPGAQKTNTYEIVSSQELASIADPIVTLGGDGTLIGVARYSANGRSPVMLGVNFGNLGFLTEVSPNELFDALRRVLSGKAHYAERSMLRADVYRGRRQIFSSQAVNDAVVQKGVRDRLLDLDVAVDKQEIMRLRADGVILSTPTGSTAYSLAAGGSIVHPSLAVVLLTPICPHSLTNRPLILGADSVISIAVPQYDGKVFLSIDGQISSELSPADQVRVTKAANVVRFVRSERKSYFDILRTKLNWGIANKSD